MFLTARFIPNAAEKVYARGIYRAYSQFMSFLTGLLPFSLAEVLFIAVPLLLAGIFIAGIVRSFIKRSGVEFLKSLRFVLAAVFVIWSWYMLGCGTNYYRSEFSEFSGLEVRPSTVDELYGLCDGLAREAVAAREEAVAEAIARGSMSSKDEVYASYLTTAELGSAARDAMRRLAEDYPVMRGYYPRPKPVFFSRVMSRFGFTGVYFPWTVEANVNVDAADFTISATMCHELSHLRGFMREDEANFIAFLAGIGSDEPELRYSAYMLALVYSANRLYAESPELWRQIRALYSDGVAADFIADAEYWREFEDTVTSDIGENVNNAYLKANRQTDGTKSYGRMVDLLLAWWREG